MKVEEIDRFIHPQWAGGYLGDTIPEALLDCSMNKLLQHKKILSGREAEKHNCLAVLNIATMLLNCSELRGGPRVRRQGKSDVC